MVDELLMAKIRAGGASPVQHYESEKMGTVDQKCRVWAVALVIDGTDDDGKYIRGSPTY